MEHIRVVYTFLIPYQALIFSFCFLVFGIASLVLWLRCYRLYRKVYAASEGMKVTVTPADDRGITLSISPAQPAEISVRSPQPAHAALQTQGRERGIRHIGISTGLFYDREIFGSLPLIKEAGFDFVEIWTGPQAHDQYTHFDWHLEYQVKALSLYVKALGLKVNSLHAPFSPSINIADPDEGRRRAAVSETLRTVDVLKYLDGEILVIHPANSENHLPGREHRLAQSRKSIEEIFLHVESLGLKMAVENQLPHILGGDPQTLRTMVQDLPEETVGFCFDTSHANLYPGRNIEQPFSQLSDRVMALHVSDNYGERDDHFAIGDGRIDWNSFTNTLRNTNYGGVFMLEVSRESLQRNRVSGLGGLYRHTAQFLQ